MSVTIKLSRPYPDMHNEGRLFDAVELREPTYGDVWRSGLGLPVEYQPGGEGRVIVITHHDLVATYIDKLITKPSDPGVLSQLSVADGLKLERAVLDFFLDQPASTKSETGSSSTEATQPNLSKA